MFWKMDVKVFFFASILATSFGSSMWCLSNQTQFPSALSGCDKGVASDVCQHWFFSNGNDLFKTTANLTIVERSESPIPLALRLKGIDALSDPDYFAGRLYVPAHSKSGESYILIYSENLQHEASILSNTTFASFCAADYIALQVAIASESNATTLDLYDISREGPGLSFSVSLTLSSSFDLIKGATFFAPSVLYVSGIIQGVSGIYSVNTSDGSVEKVEMPSGSTAFGAVGDFWDISSIGEGIFHVIDDGVLNHYALCE